MDIKESRQIFVKKILKAIPDHIKPVDYLIDVLNISKGSAYRRINSQLPFTYDEIIELSLQLNFSWEELMLHNSGDKAVFTLPGNMDIKPHDFFLNVLKGYYQNLLSENKAAARSCMMAINNLWLIFILGTDNLFKFFYKKWYLQFSSLSLNSSTNNIVIPTEIYEQRDKICNQMQSINNTTFIIDKLVYYNTIKDIQYYYRRKIINKEELFLLKDDLEKIINHAEMQVLECTYKEVTHYFFLSYLNIYSNSLYVEYDDKCQSFFYEYSIRPLRTTDKRVCTHHKRWLEALIKNSVFISASNEIVQLDFFQKQKSYLECLIEDKELIP